MISNSRIEFASEAFFNSFSLSLSTLLTDEMNEWTEGALKANKTADLTSRFS